MTNGHKGGVSKTRSSSSRDVLKSVLSENFFSNTEIIMIRGAEVEMCGSGPSGKTQVFPPGFSFLRHQFISVVVFTSAHAGKKRNGDGADHFQANFGPIFRNVTRCSCNHDFQRRKRMWTMQPHGFLPHAEGAQSQECLPSPAVWLDKCSKSQFPLSDGIRKGSTTGQWFFRGKWVASSPWRSGVQTRKHKLLLQNVHRCVVLDPPLDVA